MAPLHRSLIIAQRSFRFACSAVRFSPRKKLDFDRPRNVPRERHRKWPGLPVPVGGNETRRPISLSSSYYASSREEVAHLFLRPAATFFPLGQRITPFLEISSNAKGKTCGDSGAPQMVLGLRSRPVPIVDCSSAAPRRPVDLIGLPRINFRPAFSSLTTASSRLATMKLCAAERVMSVRAIVRGNLPYFGIRRINFNDR